MAPGPGRWSLSGGPAQRCDGEDTITAEYTDGILTIKVLVSVPETAGRTIPITVGPDKK
ncbi:hypothetical protein [Plantactinospora sp. KLBMP9567]|uniref:hypothetical protein n=1 Tax=Plantactinospora sp. KLBMP9567 TaxID=3085900 RepID=UPI002980C791|nr:hypothetical protein [Plantactinospora sp. KLBMP9567]MDW5330429.1 hypothetical protein [Plantactinospora sp. KLBMP9567]